MALLQTVAVNHNAEMEMSAAACRGLALVIDLLTDKLDIEQFNFEIIRDRDTMLYRLSFTPPPSLTPQVHLDFASV